MFVVSVSRKPIEPEKMKAIMYLNDFNAVDYSKEISDLESHVKKIDGYDGGLHACRISRGGRDVVLILFLFNAHGTIIREAFQIALAPQPNKCEKEVMFFHRSRMQTNVWVLVGNEDMPSYFQRAYYASGLHQKGASKFPVFCFMSEEGDCEQWKCDLNDEGGLKVRKIHLSP